MASPAEGRPGEGDAMALSLWEADVTARTRGEAIRIVRQAAEASRYVIVDIVGARQLSGSHRWRIEAAVRPREAEDQ